MRKLFPALALFGATALGLVAMRETVNQNTPGSAKPAIAASAEADEAEIPTVTPHQIRTASLRKENDGHYWATAMVNDMPVKFLVDTGASLVALTRQDARRVGLDTDKLEKTAEVRTAAGRVKAATAMLDHITIDGVTVKNIQAVIIDDGLEHSLLGMTFLNRITGWDVTPNAIVLRQ